MFTDTEIRLDYGDSPKATEKEDGKRSEEVCGQIDSIGNKMNIPDTIIELAKISAKANTKLIKHKTTEVIAATSLYIACRQTGAPRSFKEVSPDGLKSADIKKCFNLLNKKGKVGKTMSLVKSVDYIPRFTANLGLPSSIMTTALEIVEEVEEIEEIYGKSPISIAAAAVFIASQKSEENHQKTIKEVSARTGVSIHTIQSIYNSFLSSNT